MLDSPPPLERFSADKFRRWLADMVSTDKPPTETDRDSMKAALVGFLAVCPMVYGMADREPLWERIGNAAIGALETCNNDLMTWANDVLAAIQASAGRVATCDRMKDALAALASRDDSWQMESLRVMRELRFVLPVLARESWTQYKLDNGTEYQGGSDDAGE